MKKLVSFGLAAAMVVSLAACGSGSNSGSGSAYVQLHTCIPLFLYHRSAPYLPPNFILLPLNQSYNIRPVPPECQRRNNSRHSVKLRQTKSLQPIIPSLPKKHHKYQKNGHNHQRAQRHKSCHCHNENKGQKADSSHP